MSTSGRPRSSDVTDRVLAAAEQLFGERGFGPVTMAEVAAQAGVGLDSIYRRWSSKQRLLMDVVARAASERIPVADRGSLEADLVAIVRSVVSFAEGSGGKVLAAAIGEAAHDNELAALLAAAQERRRHDSVPVIKRAIERGELHDGSDGDLLLDVVNGVVWQRVLVAGKGLRRDQPQRLVRALLQGFGC